MITRKLTVILLLVVFFVAFFARFYKLNEYPVGFHIDEAILGYSAYSLLLTGKDTNNNYYPFYTEVFGDNLPTGYHFLSMIPVKLFGLTVFSTRFIGAFFGSITIFAIFLLAYSIFRDKKVALLSAFLVALSPWHVSLSRGSSEAEVALFFIIFGFALVLLSLYNQQKKYIFSGIALLLASYFFYHTPRIFVPMIYTVLLGFLYFQWKKLTHQYKTWLLGSFFTTSVIAVLLVFVLPGGSSRFNQISIFSFPETKLVMEEQIREDGVMGSSIFLTRVFHNKIVSYTMTFVSQYMAYFSGEFLFMKGGRPLMFTIPQVGLMYLIELPFLLAGILAIFTSKKHLFLLPVAWLLLAPVIGSVTVDDIPNVRRAIAMVPALEIIAAVGFFSFFSFVKRKNTQRFFIGLVGIIFFFNVAYFFHQYFVNAAAHRTWYRNNGFAELMKTLQESYNSYDRILMTKATGGVYPLVLFYTKFDPSEYQKAGSPKDKEYMGFGKFLFVPQECPFPGADKRYPANEKMIYVDSGECKDRKAIKIKHIYKEDDTRAYQVLYGT